MNTFIILGSGGRLSIVAKQVIPADSNILQFTRETIVSLESKDCLNALLKKTASDKIFLVDGSIDSSCAVNYEKHERFKQNIFEYLVKNRNDIKYIGFGSGASHFYLHEILTDFHKKYSEIKREQKSYYPSLFVDCYIPDIFVVVGPIMYASSSTAWAKVLRSAIQTNRVEISDRYNQRTWVSESTISHTLRKFISEGGVLTSTLSDGEFSLDDIVTFASLYLKKEVVVLKREMSNWLSVPYVSRHQSATSLPHSISLNDTLRICVNA